MDEEKKELTELEPAPEDIREETPAKPGNMRTHYLIRILVGAYLAYLGWQLTESYIKGTASSNAVAIIGGVAFLLIGGALVIWSVVLLARDNS